MSSCSSHRVLWLCGVWPRGVSGGLLVLLTLLLVLWVLRIHASSLNILLLVVRAVPSMALIVLWGQAYLRVRVGAGDVSSRI